MDKSKRIELALELWFRTQKDCLELLRIRFNALAVIFGSTITAMLIVLPNFHHFKDGSSLLIIITIAFLGLSSQILFKIHNDNTLATLQYLQNINKYNAILTEIKISEFKDKNDKLGGILGLDKFVEEEKKFFRYYIPSILSYIGAYLLEVCLY
jgi:hypothetical protein